MIIPHHKQVMTDLETYGTRPGCGILSIGAVFWDWRTQKPLGPRFYAPVSRESCLEAGLREQEDTLRWWNEQGKAARVVWQEIETAKPLKEVLKEFSDWLAANKDGGVSGFWGNGADFDNPILQAAYHAVGFRQPWGDFNGRCYRTLKNLRTDVKLKREGTLHNALDDAVSQALHAVKLCKALGVK